MHSALKITYIEQFEQSKPKISQNKKIKIMFVLPVMSDNNPIHQAISILAFTELEHIISLVMDSCTHRKPTEAYLLMH